MAVLCCVHCLLTPLLLILLPALGGSFWVREDFHVWMLLLVIPTTVLAVYMGCRKHRNRSVLILSVLGLSLLIGGILVGHIFPATACCPAHQEVGMLGFGPSTSQKELNMSASVVSILRSFPLSAESIWTSLGGLLLAAAHFRNFFLCRRACCRQCV